MARKVIENGGYVAGVVYSDDYYKAKYILTNAFDDISRIKGKKYIFPGTGEIYKNTKNY